MPNLSHQEIAELAANAGFTGSDLEIAVAVSIAENRQGRTDLLGDLNLQTAEYGPSVGLWQIRSVNPGYGNAFDQAHRNQQANLDPATNAANAYAIYTKPRGKGWNEWSTYKDGQYRRYLDQARRAIGTGSPPLPARRGDAGGGAGGHGMTATLRELAGSLPKLLDQSDRLGNVARQAQQTAARGGAFGDVPGSRVAERGNQRNAGQSARRADGARTRLDEVHDGVKDSGAGYERYDQDQGQRQDQQKIQLDNAYDAYQNYA
jgi:lysozyme-like protein